MVCPRPHSPPCVRGVLSVSGNSRFKAVVATSWAKRPKRYQTGLCKHGEAPRRSLTSFSLAAQRAASLCSALLSPSLLPQLFVHPTYKPHSHDGLLTAHTLKVTSIGTSSSKEQWRLGRTRAAKPTRTRLGSRRASRSSWTESPCSRGKTAKRSNPTPSWRRVGPSSWYPLSRQGAR